jgi:hypothetical protein
MEARTVVAAAFVGLVLLALAWPRECITELFSGASTVCSGRFDNFLGSIPNEVGGVGDLAPRLRVQAVAVSLGVTVLLLATGWATRRHRLSWTRLALTLCSLLVVVAASLVGVEQDWFSDGSGVRQLTDG